MPAGLSRAGCIHEIFVHCPVVRRLLRLWHLCWAFSGIGPATSSCRQPALGHGDHFEPQPHSAEDPRLVEISRLLGSLGLSEVLGIGRFQTWRLAEAGRVSIPGPRSTSPRTSPMLPKDLQDTTLPRVFHGFQEGVAALGESQYIGSGHLAPSHGPLLCHRRSFTRRGRYHVFGSSPGTPEQEPVAVVRSWHAVEAAVVKTRISQRRDVRRRSRPIRSTARPGSNPRGALHVSWFERASCKAPRSYLAC